ncbi:hypothetical protein ANCCAN_20732 [Ancylostoma caninum]|uniref:Uncharacterized protein n=1 Tax=Ancylostoma caninum TaxID=29170 RepID=A0A368FMZ9_ANCCA|nr:hypothetical protein ANCCAN_20732 [Ancylostoma caninum]
MVSSTSNRSLSEMSGFSGTVESPLLNVPPPLPPRLRDPTRPDCLLGPSSSGTSHKQPAATKCIDEYRLFPCTLEVPQSDFDANSVGFVDIQELRELDDSMNKVSTVRTHIAWFQHLLGDDLAMLSEFRLLLLASDNGLRLGRLLAAPRSSTNDETKIVCLTAKTVPSMSQYTTRIR